MPRPQIMPMKNRGLVDRIKGAVKGWNWSWQMQDQWASQGFQLYGLPAIGGTISTSSMQSLCQQYVSWTYKCSSFNAQAAAKVPLRLYISEKEAIGGPGKTIKSPPIKRWNFPTERIRDNRIFDYLRNERSFQKYIKTKDMVVEEVLDHPLLSLLRQVNYGVDQFDLLELTVIYQELCGNAYWYVQSAEMGGVEIPIAVYQVMPQYMTIVHDKKKGIVGYIWQKDTPQEIPFKADEIIHHKYPNPNNVLYGMGKVAGAANDIGIDNKMAEWQTALLDNRAVPEYALIAPPGDAGMLMDPEEYDEFLERWNKRNRGADKAGAIGLLEGGVKVEKLSYSPQDLGFDKEQQWVRDKITSLFGIPKGLITSDNVNKANAQVHETVHARNTIHPILRRLQDRLNEQLTPRYDKRLFLAFDNPVPEDKKLRLEEIEKKLKMGYSSINMEREKDGEGPVAWGEEPIMVTNMAPLGSVPPAGVPGAGAGVTGEQVRDAIRDTFDEVFGTEEDWKSFDDTKKEVKGPELKIGGKIPEGVKDIFWNYYDKSVKAQTKVFEKGIVKFFRKLGRKVLREFDRLTKGKKDLSAEVMLFDMDDATEMFAGVSEPYVRMALVEAGQGIINMLGKPEYIFDVNDPKVREYTGARLQEFSRKINQTTKDRVQNALRLGYEAQESIPDIRNRVDDVFTQAIKGGLESPADVPGWRAELIARTEIAGAHNFGNMTGMKQVGVERHMWITSRDALVRDHHVMLDGVETIVGQPFPGYYDGFDPAWPSSYSERCTTLPTKMKQPEVEEEQSAVEAVSEME